MFKLKLKDGAEVSTLEELRDNFDLEAVVDYFKNGDLLTWLEDRFYDDEADAISEIDADDRNLSAKICAALNVECDDNLEFMQRVHVKKSILSDKTDDETIIDNAVSTALNQEDLAELIQMDYKTIFLCGELFNVPIRVPGMKYIGILGTPKIKIRAKTQEEVDAKQISFENVQLPWQKAAPIEELKALAEKIFQTGGKFPIVKDGKQVSTFDQLDKTEKSAALRMVCQGKYAEHQIAFMQLTDDLSLGFALTVDSFCVGGEVTNSIIEYKSITEIEIHLYVDYGNAIQIKSTAIPSSWGITYYDHHYKEGSMKKLFGSSKKMYNSLKQFLDVVKNF